MLKQQQWRSAHAVGRKRKSGERYPGGQLKHRTVAEEQADAMSVALQARVDRGLAATLDDARDQRCATELGRLQRDGAITLEQCNAGQEYARARHAYLVAIGAPWPHPTQPPPAAGEMDADAAKRARAIWLAASQALIDAGYAAHQAVQAVALEDAPTKDVEYLRYGLRVLARHFGFRT